MKTDKLNMTAEELDELCRLYMECKLSVLEEKELEYLLSRTDITSPHIAEVRSLIGVQLLPTPLQAARKTIFSYWKHISGVAASVAVMLSVALYFASPWDSNLYDGDSVSYIAAYNHGTRLDGNDAVTATNLAMAKADSLMNYASLTEREYLLRANDIINETFNN